MRVISIFWWPGRAAMASSRMPRLMAWVARVWRSRCGWGPATSRLRRPDVAEVRGGPGAGQPDEVGVQGHVPVVAELAERDPQPVPGADLHDRVRVQAGQLPGPHAGAGQQLGHEPVTRAGAGPGRGHRPGRAAVAGE